ncbi:hypothetical protein I204_02750 [Kwoniella mangroviensis CBS 8886]|nr:hypothetical protein I204_02750 [Kwoniella mangroviensis CBS 8886]
MFDQSHAITKSQSISTQLDLITRADAVSKAAWPLRPKISQEYFEARRLLSDQQVYNTFRDANQNAHNALTDHYFPRLTRDNSTIGQRINRAMNLSNSALAIQNITYPERLELTDLLEDEEVKMDIKQRDETTYNRIMTGYGGGVKHIWQWTNRGGPPRIGEDPSYGFHSTTTTRYLADGSVGARDWSANITLPTPDIVLASLSQTLRNLMGRADTQPSAVTSQGSATDDKDESEGEYADSQHYQDSAKS